MNEHKFVNDLIRRFRIEQEKRDRGGIYAYTQKLMAYNSNRIEGSTLTSDQTASLFDTGTIVGKDGEIYRAKDVEEMMGHFKMFNYMLTTIDRPLSEDIIKTMHYHLKSGVFEDFANGYPVGEYKNRVNIAGTQVTAAPADVEKLMQNLLNYQINSTQDIAVFHEQYEKIHPFQDGNGRTGRMIILKQCLDSRITPIIIKDDDRALYINALKRAHEGNYDSLTSYFEKQQKVYLETAIPFIYPDQTIENEIDEEHQETDGFSQDDDE